MTPDNLADIRERDAASSQFDLDYEWGAADRRALLAEVDRLDRALSIARPLGVSAERARIRKAVKGLTRWSASSWTGMVAHPTGKYVSLTAVIAAIDGEPT